MEKTNEQAADEYFDKSVNDVEFMHNTIKSFLAGAEFKESQLMPLIEEMKKALDFISTDTTILHTNGTTQAFKTVNAEIAEQTVTSIEQKLKEIKGE